ADFPLRNSAMAGVLTDPNRSRKIPNLKAFPPRFFAGSTNGETMGTAASSLVNPAELDAVGSQPTAKALARRATQRRQILAMIATSCIIDAGVLLLYGQAGTIPAIIAPAYAACGLVMSGAFLVLSELGF